MTSTVAPPPDTAPHLRTVLRSLGWGPGSRSLFENGIPFAGMAKRPNPSQQTKYHSQATQSGRIVIPANGIPFSSWPARVARHPSKPNTILKRRAVVLDGLKLCIRRQPPSQTEHPTTASRTDCAYGDSALAKERPLSPSHRTIRSYWASSPSQSTSGRPVVGRADPCASAATKGSR